MEDDDDIPLLDPQEERLRSNKSKKKSGGEETSSVRNKKQGVQRSKSGGVLSRNRSARNVRNINRSKSEDDGKSEELLLMSKSTESSSISSSKRLKSPKPSRKIKKPSKSPTREASVSPQRNGTSPLARKASALRNSISPKQRREIRSKSPNEGRGRHVANRRSSLTKLYSWWDLASNKSPKGQPLLGPDRSPSPPPAPPPLPASVRTARVSRKRSDSNPIGSPLSRSVKSAVVSRRKKGRSKSYDDENDILEISKSSLLAQDSMASPLSRSNKSVKKKGRKKSYDSMDDGLLLGDDHHHESKASSKKTKKKKKKSTPNDNYTTLPDSPSTSSLTSTISGENSLKNRFVEDEIEDTMKVPSMGDLYDNFLGQLFEVGKGDVDQSKRSTASEISHDFTDPESDDDTASLDHQEVKWIEIALDNPADVVMKIIHDDQDNEKAAEYFIVPAGTSMMNTLLEDFAHTPFKTIIEGGHQHKIKKKTKAKTKKKKKQASTKVPSLGETIGNDPKSVQNRPPDDRANCTLGTAESEQTLKATNHQHAEPRISDTVHEFGYENLKTGDDDDDDDDKLDDGSTHSRSSVASSKSRSSIASHKSSKSLPTRRGRKKNNNGNHMSQSSHEPRRALRRSMSSRRQQRAGSRDAPRRSRSRSGRAGLRRTSSHHTAKSASSEIDEFMAMTKNVVSSPNKESTDSTMSTATESTMATADTRSRRPSMGPANLNPQLIENFQLTF